MPRVTNPDKIDELNQGLPETVFKYRNWIDSKHKRILTHCEIHYASPNSFNSNDECRFYNDYESISKDDIYLYCMHTAVMEGARSQSEIKEKADYLYQINKYDDIEHRQKEEEKTKTMLNDVLSIFSVCKYDNNLKLWQSFSREHTGFCVGIDSKYIMENPEIMGSCGEVKYFEKDEMPKVKPLSFNSDEASEKMMTVIYSLPKIYEPEDEFRFAKMHISSQNVILPREAISQVVFGANMSQKHKDEITEIVKKLPNCKLKQASYDSVLGYVVVNDL